MPHCGQCRQAPAGAHMLPGFQEQPHKCLPYPPRSPRARCRLSATRGGLQARAVWTMHWAPVSGVELVEGGCDIAGPHSLVTTGVGTLRNPLHDARLARIYDQDMTHCGRACERRRCGSVGSVYLAAEADVVGYPVVVDVVGPPDPYQIAPMTNCPMTNWPHGLLVHVPLRDSAGDVGHPNMQGWEQAKRVQSMHTGYQKSSEELGCKSEGTEARRACACRCHAFLEVQGRGANPSV